MEQGNNTIVVWSIVNFSYWRLELHAKCVSNSDVKLHSGDTFEVELYPRGLSGDDEYIVVRIFTNFDSPGDISFIGSDGSIICTQQVDLAEGSELFPGPKFKDVLAQLKKNEKSHKDQLNLRFQFNLDGEDTKYDFEHFITSTTTINVQEVSLKIDWKLIESIEPPFKPKLVFSNEDVSLKTDLKGEIVKFMLEPKGDNAFLVETFIDTVSDDNTLRKEEQSRVFDVDEALWTFSDSLETEVIKKSGITVILRLVIIQQDMIESTSSKFYYDKRVSLVPDVQKSSMNFVSVFTTKDSVAVLPKELMCLYQDQDFSDFQLKCGDVSFPVHRNILSARSPVFKTMLSSNMKETASGSAEMVDLDVPTLTRFLTYLYSGGVEDLQCDSALKLYYAADKYQVPTLKMECSNHLCANLSISNVCDILSLANRHQDEGLVTVSSNFVLNNFNEVLRSKEWETFCESEPSLALRTVTQFAVKDCVVKKQEPPRQEPHPDVQVHPSQAHAAGRSEGHSVQYSNRVGYSSKKYFRR